MYCEHCGQKRVGNSLFCVSCGSSLRTGLLKARQMTQGIFREKRKVIFWGYLFGLVLLNIFFAFRANSPFANLIYLVEVVSFVLGFVRAKQNWINLWAYLLIFSFLLGILELFQMPAASIQADDGVALFVGLLATALLVREHNDTTSELGEEPWKLSSKSTLW